MTVPCGRGSRSAFRRTAVAPTEGGRPSSCSMAARSSFIWKGLAMNLSAGDSLDQSRVGSVWAIAVSRMMGIAEVLGFALSSRQASKPLFLGIMPSRMMMSGRVAVAFTTASSPFSASTRSRPWFWSMNRRMPRVFTESSAISTFFVMVRLLNPRSYLIYTSCTSFMQDCTRAESSDSGRKTGSRRHSETMKLRRALWSALLALSACGEEQRPAPAPAPAPVRKALPIRFNTPEADAILSSLQFFPKDNPWNEDISDRPVHPDSDKIVDAIGRNLRFRWNLDMPFIIVPPDQPLVPVEIAYRDESDPGPFPLPSDAPVEGGPIEPGPALEKWQREGEGDRHLIVLDPAAKKLYELFHVYRTPTGWKADSTVVFDLTSNKLRPDGWTSADAAGLPILPAVVRYDECERGRVNHALRFTVRRSRRAYVYPATHYASSLKD